MHKYLCQDCGNARTSTDNTPHIIWDVAIPKGKGELTLQGLIDSELSGSDVDDLRCETCQKNTTNLKQDTPTGNQPYLIIGIKRITETPGRKNNVVYGKDSSSIVFPHTMVTIGSGNNAVSYQPVAIVQHEGRKLGSGHYVCSRLVRGKWWYLDDDDVEEMDLANGTYMKHHNQAYIVLLERQTTTDDST